MQIIFKSLLILLLLLVSSSLSAQVGINTITPDTSSILDVSSNSKGFLMPRLTTNQRNSIEQPAAGLMIYNTTLNDGQLNTGTPEAPHWVGIKNKVSPASMIESVTEVGVISTTSTEDFLVPGMTISPNSGTYMVFFNGQMSHKVFSLSQGVDDLSTVYDDLLAYPNADNHGVTFGNETLNPGVYDVAGAHSISGSLTLDGGGDPNAIFIIRGSGALTIGDSATVNLINGANSNNIFWVAEGAITIGENSIMKGNLIAHPGAITMESNAELEGRMFSTTGAIVMDSATLNAPVGVSFIDLRELSTFVIFSSNGAVSNAGISVVNGDVGAADGDVSGFAGINGHVYTENTTTTNESNAATAIYSIYQNGIEVANSSRAITSNSSIVSLQVMLTAIAGESIEIRWKVDNGEMTMNHRILSLIRN
ncbi:DUF3494 domain-containing protein [Bizionia saleffrena]|uniref:DUF3494 domain-containing protein n=1 Tax=Bizionia saleffrena TaxID=291189 RepID=A0A8H2LCW7_9FLAO|nr:ice-binding family protein [Bizionia saleffrena]TYB74482.1 DUF3494 domain-containing protein [Bizionia saleffrena]